MYDTGDIVGYPYSGVGAGIVYTMIALNASLVLAIFLTILYIKYVKDQMIFC